MNEPERVCLQRRGHLLQSVYWVFQFNTQEKNELKMVFRISQVSDYIGGR